MNPFDRYCGLVINGKFYQKNELGRLAQDDKEEAFTREVLSFADQLFKNTEEVTFQTSGSTGKPKAISFSKSAILKSADDTNQFFSLHKSHKALLSLPVAYVAGKMMIARAIAGEYELMCTPPSGAPLNSNIDFDFAPFTPYQFEQIIDNQKDLLPDKAIILLGGSSVSSSLHKKIREVPNAVYLGFGMTETLTHFAVGDLKSENFFFKNLPDTEIKIDDGGELSVFRNGITSKWIKTTDIVKPISGGFIWKGRKDHIINSGGVKLHPEEIEKELAPYFSRPYFIYGLDDEKLGEKAVLFIEGTEETDLSSVQFAKKYSKPRDVIKMEKFLRTQSGKIKRKATVDRWLNG